MKLNPLSKSTQRTVLELDEPSIVLGYSLHCGVKSLRCCHAAANDPFVGGNHGTIIISAKQPGLDRLSRDYRLKCLEAQKGSITLAALRRQP